MKEESGGSCGIRREGIFLLDSRLMVGLWHISGEGRTDTAYTGANAIGHIVSPCASRRSTTAHGGTSVPWRNGLSPYT